VPQFRESFRTEQGADARLRVMVVDDAVVVRGLVSRWLSDEADMVVVACHPHGRSALDDLDRADPDVVVLDLDMPEMDGLTALPLLLRRRPDLCVLVCSTLTRRNAELSMRCLSLGADDYVPKPQSGREFSTSTEFRAQLVEKIRALGQKRRSARERRGSAAAPMRGVAHLLDAAATAWPGRSGPGFRAYSAVPPGVIMIGASTGGPQSVSALVGGLREAMDRTPVLVALHMPAIFTSIFAEHLRGASGRPSREAQDGERIEAGTIYVAPGSAHLVVARQAGVPVIRLDPRPAVNFCKPSIDLMFSSGAAIWGSSALAIILTGMGADGTAGAADVARSGGTVLAQDAGSSAVWGMPGSVVKAGVCSGIGDPEQLARIVRTLVSGGQP
jgi:two-component system chemotaxis response regulator CheB